MTNKYDALLEKLDSMALPDVDFAKYYEQNHEDNAKVKRPVDFIDEIFARLRGEHKQYGTPMPWGKTHENIRFRPAEVPILLSDTTKIEKLGFNAKCSLKEVVNDQLNHYLSEKERKG